MITTQFLHCKLSMVIGSARLYVEGLMCDALLCIYWVRGKGLGLGLVLIDLLLN